MARKYAYRPRDRHRFRLCGIELPVADADREDDHRRSLVGTALLRLDDQTAHTGAREWLNGRRKESSGCAALSIRVNRARKDWNKSSTRSTPNVRPAIPSQRHEGWTLLRDRYDDGGLSGGTMERPALQRLLADIAAGRIDIVVVYKVDRLTRALSDFARIVELFDRHNVSFVSVTQAFNTTTSMGRLTLNVLLSFAQFEREVTGERIRDKIAASKKKGMWMGGQPSLGYDVHNRKLVINEAEAESVRMIFRRYAELKSVRDLRAELDAAGDVGKARMAGDGSPCGGQRLRRGGRYPLLQKKVFPGGPRGFFFR